MKTDMREYINHIVKNQVIDKVFTSIDSLMWKQIHIAIGNPAWCDINDFSGQAELPVRDQVQRHVHRSLGASL